MPGMTCRSAALFPALPDAAGRARSWCHERATVPGSRTMTYPGTPRPEDDPRPRPDTAPGSEPLDPWAEEEAARRAEQDAVRRAEQGWVSQSGGMGPLPARTWRRGNTRVTVGGCCLPLPIGCLTTLVATAAVAAKVARRGARG